MARHGQNPVRARGEIPTVAEAVEEFFKEFGPSWVGRNTEHAYRGSLAKYVLPVNTPGSVRGAWIKCGGLT